MDSIYLNPAKYYIFVVRIKCSYNREVLKICTFYVLFIGIRKIQIDEIGQWNVRCHGVPVSVVFVWAFCGASINHRDIRYASYLK